MSAAAEYVAAAISAMRVAATEDDLINWWKDEKRNRDLLKLTPSDWPGLDLLSAFQARRIKLKGTENEDLRRISKQVSQSI